MRNLEEVIKNQKELVNRYEELINSDELVQKSYDARFDLMLYKKEKEKNEEILKFLEELEAYRKHHDKLCDYYKVNSIEEIYGKAIDDFFDVLDKYAENDSWVRLKMSSIYYISEELKKN